MVELLADSLCKASVCKGSRAPAAAHANIRLLYTEDAAGLTLREPLLPEVWRRMSAPRLPAILHLPGVRMKLTRLRYTWSHNI